MQLAASIAAAAAAIALPVMSSAAGSAPQRPRQNSAITCPLGSFLQSKSFEVEAGAGGAVAADTKCVPCPAGRFGNVTGLDSPRCSGICSAGYFCAKG